MHEHRIDQPQKKKTDTCYSLRFLKENSVTKRICFHKIANDWVTVNICILRFKVKEFENENVV